MSKTGYTIQFRAHPSWYARRNDNTTYARLSLAIPLLCLASSAAQADGTFFQLDLGAPTADAVLAATRGKMSYGANYSNYESGWSAGIHVTRDFAIEDFGTLKIGPSLGTSDEVKGIKLGGKIILERYQPTNFGFLFLSAQYNTNENDWFTLAQIGNAQGLSVDLTAGGSDNYSEQSVAVNYRLNGGPTSFRGGYRFDAKEVFIGVSVNTY